MKLLSLLDSDVTPMLLCMGLVMLGLLITGAVQPIRALVLPVYQPEAACQGRPGQTVVMDDGRTYIAVPDESHSGLPCLLRPKIPAQPGRAGKWQESGEPVTVKLGGTPGDSRLILEGSHSGRIEEGLGFFPTLLIILGSASFISLFYGVIMLKRREIRSQEEIE